MKKTRYLVTSKEIGLFKAFETPLQPYQNRPSSLDRKGVLETHLERLGPHFWMHEKSSSRKGTKNKKTGPLK